MNHVAIYERPAPTDIGNGPESSRKQHAENIITSGPLVQVGALAKRVVADYRDEHMGPPLSHWHVTTAGRYVQAVQKEVERAVRYASERQAFRTPLIDERGDTPAPISRAYRDALDGTQSAVRSEKSIYNRLYYISRKLVPLDSKKGANDE